MAYTRDELFSVAMRRRDVEFDRLREENEALKKEIVDLKLLLRCSEASWKALNESRAERVAAQSELLSKKAEKGESQ